MAHPPPEQHLEELGAFVHGLLAFGHLLGIAHNIKKRNVWDVVLHGAAFGYDLWSVFQHKQSVRELQTANHTAGNPC